MPMISPSMASSLRACNMAPRAAGAREAKSSVGTRRVYDVISMGIYATMARAMPLVAPSAVAHGHNAPRTASSSATHQGLISMPYIDASFLAFFARCWLPPLHFISETASRRPLISHAHRCLANIIILNTFDGLLTISARFSRLLTSQARHH